MRLNRLDLTRYGRFSDAQIVLPVPKGDTADVTVIYGPNEAGKSTAFTGFLELLFGMKPRDHPYEFRFKRSDLLIGAELDLPDRGLIVMQRNSKRTQSLLDAQGRPVDEAILTGALHGLGREDYVERFSLNDEGLRKGGARIAGAQGDLGQLLHAGVSGLTSMADTLDQMGARADQFHKKGGRSTALKGAKDRLKEIGEDLRAARLTPDRERVLGVARDNAKAVFDAADGALATARMREAASKAAQVWYDLTQEIGWLDAALLAYPDGPDLRKGAAEKVAGLVATITEKTARMAEADDTIAQHATTIAQNPADPVAEPLALELSQLDQLTIDGAPLMARATTATSDLGRRIENRDKLCDQIGQILAGLSLPDAAAASLALTTRELEDLGRAAQAVLSAQAAVDAASDAVIAAQGQHGEAPPEPQDLSHLQAAWGAWQAVADISVSQNAVTVETARLATAVSGLPKAWPALVEAGLPARETLVAVARDVVGVALDLTAAQAECEARDANYQLAQAQRQADEAGPAAIDVATTGQARRLRDARWVTHRGALSVQTADAFESAMHDDDDAQASFAVGAQARQQLATSRRDENAALVLRDNAQARLVGLAQKHKALTARSAVMASVLGLAKDTNADAFTDRFSALVHAAQIATQLKNATAECDVLSTRRMEATADLSAAAKLVGMTCADHDLPVRVQAALTLQDSVQQAWTTWARAKEGIAGLQAKAAQAMIDRDDAAHALATLTAVLPLAKDTAQDVIAALPSLRELQRLHAEHQKLGLRVEALERAVAQLDACAARITVMVGDDDTGAGSLAVIANARSRVAMAERTTTLRDTAQAEQAKDVAIRAKAAGAIDAAENELKGWFEGQGAAGQSPVERVEGLAERDGLRAKRQAHDAARKTARVGVNADLFDAELALLPDATRAAQMQQMLDDADRTRDAARDAHVEAVRLYQEAFDAADRSDLATEQATILEELRAGARAAAVARLGVLAAKGALRRLASERRTTMLHDVEEAFVAITAPAWRGVDVWSQSEGEKLVGVQPDGTAVPVDMMSTGTMGQLYFALRVAGYRGFARDLGPLPMILDDIMETFDDGRAKAALQLCADIGRSGQAIIFTHHAHLVDLARETIAGVHIVEMPR